MLLKYSILLILILYLFTESEISALNPHHCKCERLVKRTFITFGSCGECAGCWWNLQYYITSFAGSIPSALAPLAADGMAQVTFCAGQMPFPAYFEDPNDPSVCLGLLKLCQKQTDMLFEIECARLYGDKLKLPANNTWEFKKYINRTISEEWKEPPPFTATEPYYYPRTCPSIHNRYAFTYYLLFDAAYKSHKGNTTDPNFQQWDEDLHIAKVAASIRPDALLLAVKDVENIFTRYGIDSFTRRFCGHTEVLVCLDN